MVFCAAIRVFTLSPSLASAEEKGPIIITSCSHNTDDFTGILIYYPRERMCRKSTSPQQEFLTLVASQVYNRWNDQFL